MKEVITEHDSEKLKREKLERAAADHKEKVTKEAEEQVARWSKTGMLKGIVDEYARGQMAILLENQRLINEYVTDSGDMHQFKRVSIPIVRRVYDPRVCLAWDLVSIQALIGPTGFAFFNRPDGEIFEEVPAKTKKTKCVFDLAVHEDIRTHHNLDKEAEQTAVMAAKLCDEMNEEVINDLTNNVGIHVEMDWQGPEALWDYLGGLLYRFEHETGPGKSVPFGKKPNWIVTSEGLAAELKKHVEFEPRIDDLAWIAYGLTCRRTGVLNKEITLIECKNLLPNDILVGYKDGPHGSGYVYMPYVPFTRTPIILDLKDFLPKAGILTRYGKRLSVKGSHFYARLSVKGHVIEEVKEAVEGSLDMGADFVCAENVDKG